MSKISADNISNKDDTKEIPTDTVIAGSAKAWVNFDGTGTVAIRDSFNVSSITDNGTGDYTVNFTNAMNDANYSLAAISDHPHSQAISYSVGNFSIKTLNTLHAASDSLYANIVVSAN